MDSKFILFSVGILVVLCTMLSLGSGDTLVTIDGELVRMINNCSTEGTAKDTSCPANHCCTKKALQYPADYVGDMPKFQLECKPLRQPGEFCYFSTPENFCPCARKCHSNGFYGHCV